MTQENQAANIDGGDGCTGRAATTDHLKAENRMLLDVASVALFVIDRK